MIDPRYSEDEQAERLKEWWQKNGASVIIGAVIGLGTILGVNYWRDYTQSRAEAASARFAQLLSAPAEEAESSGSELMAEYNKTPYAALAALHLAKTSYTDGDTEKVVTLLKWAIDNGRQTATRHVARLRLARVYLEQGQAGDAERLLEVKQYDGFESEYKELVGDIAMLQGDAERARGAYEDALSTLPQGSRYSELLVFKLDNAIGGGGLAQ